MDKYAVDLDKVLNDFEYSELTDHYNTAPSVTAGGYDYIQRNNNVLPSPSYAKHRGDVKHSITNVFNSLDEYINTDISATYGAVTNYSLNALNQTQTIDGSNVNVLEYGDRPRLQDRHENINENVQDESSESVETKKVVDKHEIVDKTKEVDRIVETNEVVSETKGVDDDETVSETLVRAQSGQVEDKEVDVVVIEETHSVESIKNENKEAPTDDKDVSFRSEHEVHKSHDQIGDVYETQTGEVPATKSVATEPIGFTDKLDCDENELNRYLEELEKEMSTKETGLDEKTLDGEVVNEKTVDGDTGEEKTTLDCNIVEEMTNDGRKTVDERTSVVEEKTIISETADYNKTQENELVIEESLENKRLDDKVVEVTVDMNKGSSESSQCVDSESVENVVEGTIKDTVTVKTDDVRRPVTLSLSEEKREINLIGDPGSTPYNNIYVSKQLPQGKKVESDTDTSRSASPTFSDISSDCTTSTTPSTETVNEEDFVGKGGAGDDGSNNSQLDNSNDPVVDVSVNVDNSEGVEQSVDDSVSDVRQQLQEESLNSQDVLPDSQASGDDLTQQNTGPEAWLGKQAPLWIPDSEALSCLHCDMKFTVIKRRHHCRACGLVLCSKCCNMRFRLEYLDAEARVCAKCYDILSCSIGESSIVGSTGSPSRSQPNPNNPMEYCSMVPPLQQVSSVAQNPPPTVMVPVSVLKRKGSNKTRSNKSVMFCDGIRPGSDLTNLDSDFNYSESRPPTVAAAPSKKNEKTVIPKTNRNVPAVDPTTKSYIPNSDNSLPPTVTIYKTDVTYTECSNNANVVEMLRNETLTFAVQRNLLVHVKIINMNCCINKTAWCFSTEGLINVGQDEIVILLEYDDDERGVPKDIFHHINNIYNDAVKGTTVKELGISLHDSTNFLNSKNHAGFLYIRPTFQCLQNVIKPKEIFLIGILIHRWETPWAKIFPLRLILRLGAEYRYYPSPIISTRHRESVFVEIGHTIINLLADFRNFSYTLPQIRGLTIHMEDKNTTVTIPTNRYDQVMKSISNSSDHILAFAGNFSTKADSHLVCIQDTQGNNENSYTTHAINIHNKPRKVTGASFIVFNGALKSSSGLTAKSSIVEDGLMIQIPADDMVQIRESLRGMKDHTIQCGCINSVSDESVSIIWGEPDTNFNIGVTSPIDDQSLSGVPSIRVHNGKDYVCNSGNRLIRWTEVFILQNSEEGPKNQDPIDVSKLAENISKATCQALVKYLDLLCTNNFYKIGIRATLHVENVSYSAGSNSVKLPPIYMKSLDNELVPVLHRITTSNNLGENAIVLELIFRILNV